MIQTKNLQLLPVELTHITAFLQHKNRLADLLGVSIPDSWPIFPEAFSLPPEEDRQSQPSIKHWQGYFFLNPIENVLVGNGGFTGEPNQAGTVEIGYEIAAEYWNRGFATEIVKGLLTYAFSHNEVKHVIAHTLAQSNASNRVLEKSGLSFNLELEDPEEGKIWQWQISRNEFHPS